MIFPKNIKKTKIIFEDDKYKISIDKLKYYLNIYKKKYSKKKKQLVFIKSDLSFGFLINYFLFLSLKYPLVILDPKISKKQLADNIKVFKPNFLLEPSKNKKRNFGFKLKILSKLNHKFNPELRLLISTSGSTGKPKLVMLSEKNLKSNTFAICDYLKLKSNDSTILNLPTNYSYGLSIINTHFSKGSKILILKKIIIDKYFWEKFVNEKITTFYGVPETFDILKKIKIKKNNFSNLKFFAVAGGKIKKNTLNYFKNLSTKNKIDFFNMYGQTEASPRISYSQLKKNKYNLNSIGKALKGGKISLLDEKGKKIKKINVVGEILYSGPNVMLGYANNYKDLNNKRTNKYKLYTNDIGYFDKYRNIILLGRNSRFAKIDSKRIYLDDIDNFLNKKDVNSVSVDWKNNVFIFINKKVNEKEITNLIKKNFNLKLNQFKIRILKNIPKTNNNKINYKKLQEIAKTTN